MPFSRCKFQRSDSGRWISEGFTEFKSESPVIYPPKYPGFVSYTVITYIYEGGMQKKVW